MTDKNTHFSHSKRFDRIASSVCIIMLILMAFVIILTVTK